MRGITGVAFAAGLIAGCGAEAPAARPAAPASAPAGAPAPAPDQAARTHAPTPLPPALTSFVLERLAAGSERDIKIGGTFTLPYEVDVHVGWGDDQEFGNYSGSTFGSGRQVVWSFEASFSDAADRAAFDADPRVHVDIRPDLDSVLPKIGELAEVKTLTVTGQEQTVPLGGGHTATWRIAGAAQEAAPGAPAIEGAVLHVLVRHPTGDDPPRMWRFHSGLGTADAKDDGTADRESQRFTPAGPPKESARWLCIEIDGAPQGASSERRSLGTDGGTEPTSRIELGIGGGAPPQSLQVRYAFVQLEAYRLRNLRPQSGK